MLLSMGTKQVQLWYGTFAVRRLKAFFCCIITLFCLEVEYLYVRKHVIGRCIGKNKHNFSDSPCLFF